VTPLNSGQFSRVTGGRNGMWPILIIPIAKTLFF
jgi:hypothetical protein